MPFLLPCEQLNVGNFEMGDTLFERKPSRDTNDGEFFLGFDFFFLTTLEVIWCIYISWNEILGLLAVDSVALGLF